MIINKRSGDELALSFKKLMRKSLNKSASVSAGKMLVEEEGLANDLQTPEEGDKFAPENFMIDQADDRGDKDVLENSLADSISLFDDESSEEEEGDFGDHYEQNTGNLIGNNIDMMGDEIHDKEAASIMRGLGKIASSLSRKGEKFASDVVVAAAKDISFEFAKEQNKRKFVRGELSKIARELRTEGDLFSSDIVLATLKSI